MTLIFDTDPGVDDMLALLMLASRSQKELRLISLTYGNCSLGATLRNLLSFFAVLKREDELHTARGWPPVLLPGFKPSVALGSVAPLAEIHIPDAEDVHGRDGLAGIHTDAPEFDCPPEWLTWFAKEQPEDSSAPVVPDDVPFVVDRRPSWEAMLDLLREEPPHTVTIVAVGPLTNIARMVDADPATFSRVKQVLSMGAALRSPGNVTPLAEFNVYADPDAAALVYSLTSKHSEDTSPQAHRTIALPNPLSLKIFPLDLTERHTLAKSHVENALDSVLDRYPESVLLRWVRQWLMASFANYGALVGVGPENAEIHLHDPLTVAYIQHPDGWGESVQDVRVETLGQWSVGHTIVDNRGRAKVPEGKNPHDYHHWLTMDHGNAVAVVQQSPFSNFADIVLSDILSLGPPSIHGKHMA